jgi:hypothetical protein
LEKQVLPYLGSTGSTGSTSPGEENEDELFGADSYQNDEELKQILSSIGGDAPNDEET